MKKWLLLLSFMAFAPALGQRLVVAQGTDPITLDAPLAQDSPSATVVTHISETLFELTPRGASYPTWRRATPSAMAAEPSPCACGGV